MSEVVDDKSDVLRVSNHAGRSLLDESKSCEMIPFPMNKNNKDPNEKTVEEARKWMGVLVNKDFDNTRYMGEVVKYSGETKLFKINYDNGVSEKMNYQGLLSIVAPPPLVREYLKTKYPRWYNEMENARKRRHQPEGHCVPIHPRRYMSKTLPPQVPKPKKRKSKKEIGTSSAASPPAYIPLAFRETKKDAYIYY
ncbi:hypothetical protein V6N13_087277 [Hibiscus sabdariffa]|uniref:PTM/DIR17-like Tudor domain-containing protein n=1 Tax=Hibiscus sabdariffa TaxID=183260 RepID=A0ABR2FWB1_9ROSI